MSANPNQQPQLFNVLVEGPPVTREAFQLSNEDGPTTFSRKFALLDPYPSTTRGLYILQEQFWVQWQQGNDIYRINVPQHVLTDVASVPRLVWTFSGLTPDGLYRNAALIHDMIYMWQGNFPNNWFQHWDKDLRCWTNWNAIWSKDEADRMFLRIMKACGVDKQTRTEMYWAVKICGQIPWMMTDKSREQWRHVFDAGVPVIINA